MTTRDSGARERGQATAEGPTARAERITLVVATFGAGGSERILSVMAEQWARQGRAVRLVTLSDAREDFYALPSTVQRVGLDLLGPSTGPWSAVRANITRLRRLRSVLRDGRPDCVVSFGDSMNCLVLLSLLGTRLRVLACERNDPRHLPLGRGWSALRRRLYPRATAVVVQTERVAVWAGTFVRPTRVRVIPNFVSPPSEMATPSARSLQRYRIAAVGRLTHQKGFDLLIEAFRIATAGDRNPDWFLEIAGEGPDRADLQSRIDAAGLGDRVHLVGLRRDIGAFLASAELFVFSSRFEGFPNALMEAMAAGLPVVSFDCDSGPADIIRPGIDGALVPPLDVAALAGEMDRFMGDAALRGRSGAAAATVVDRFGVEVIMRRWETLTDASDR